MSSDNSYYSTETDDIKSCNCCSKEALRRQLVLPREINNLERHYLEDLKKIT